MTSLGRHAGDGRPRRRYAGTESTPDPQVLIKRIRGTCHRTETSSPSSELKTRKILNLRISFTRKYNLVAQKETDNDDARPLRLRTCRTIPLRNPVGRQVRRAIVRGVHQFHFSYRTGRTVRRAGEGGLEACQIVRGRGEGMVPSDRTTGEVSMLLRRDGRAVFDPPSRSTR